MKYSSHIIKLLLIISAAFLCACSAERTAKKAPLALDGILDLEHWDFSDDGIVSLDGEWEFYWKQLVKPGDADLTTSATEKDYFIIPNKWNGHPYRNRSLTGHGYATFRLTLTGIQKNDILALKVIDMATSYRLWVDGELLLENGIVGNSRESSKPGYLPQTAAFRPESGRVDIVLQVANFAHRKGGVWKPLVLGLEKQIIKARERNLSFELFLFGSLLIMGFYHIGFFVTRRKDSASLYFGSACLLTALRIILTGERFLATLIPGLGWEISQTLEYLTFYLGVPLFPMFLRSLFPEFNKKVVNGAFAVGMIFSLFSVVTPARLFSYGMPYYQILAAVYCLYTVYILARAVQNGNRTAIWVSVGVVVLIATVFHDLLLVNEIIYSIPLVPSGLFFFIFFQSTLLSLRFSKAFNNLETMSEELGRYANEMEVLVDQRTRELSDSNRELQQTNQKILESIEYASIIQASLLPDMETIKSHMPDSFFLWKPRDVVGGDCFILEPVEGGIILAAIDCTGHGIPGALMTMIASSGLKRIITGEKCHDPAKILKRLNYIVKSTLQQEKENTRSDDGLDGSICFIDKNGKYLVFAGARQPLVYILNSEVHLIKGDRQSIGYKKSNLDYDYTNHTVEIKNGSQFYLYTDGIVDQSIAGKQFSIGQKRFKDMLQKVHKEDLDAQKELIVEAFNRLRGENDIRDDITIIGFKPHNNH